ncbi:helix-turn-helix domain-containing protein [Candidatus Margulisiibacteriota bacterium]
MIKTLGEKIRAAREKKKLTREDLTRNTDLTLSAIYKIETGKMPKPSFEIIVKIAKALEISLDSLS